MSMIPGNAPTMLPGGIPVPETQKTGQQPGTRSRARTAKGSGVYTKPGSQAYAPAAPAGPERDFVVILKNPSDIDFRMRYLTVDYVISRYDELVVPWEVMCSFLGSPEVQNLSPRRQDRKHVYEKLRVKYGAYHDEELWEVNKPRLQAYRVTGERITTVIDDPDGLSITASSITQQQQLATDAQIGLLQQQLEATQRLVLQMSGQMKSPEPDISEQPGFVNEDIPNMPDWDPDNDDNYDSSQEQSPIAHAPEMTQRSVPPIGVPVTPQPNPPRVPGMSPQMPHQQAPVFVDDTDGAGGVGKGAYQGAGQKATADTPTNPVRIG